MLLDLAEDAQVLCVGTGTGAALIALAQAFPNWTFTAVDPSSAMLDICREKVENAGISSRSQFPEDYLDSLPESGKFDAATAILVSQFLLEEEQRRAFFHEIWRRLNPGTYFIHADLAAPADPIVHENLKAVWIQALRFNGLSPEAAQAYIPGWAKRVAVLKKVEIEAIVASSGFETPTLFYQSLFLHAWYAKSK